MENDRSCLIPSFARGLKILLVDHDSTSLVCVCSMLEQYAFKVTCTGLASVALSMVQELDQRFELVMANGNMPDVDILYFLQVLLDRNIPVVLMFSQTSRSEARKAIADGASFILHKPISVDDLKYIWQHAYRNKSNAMDLTRSGNFLGKENDDKSHHQDSENNEKSDGISKMVIACEGAEGEGNDNDNNALTEKICTDTGNEHGNQEPDEEMMKERDDDQEKELLREQEVGEKSSSDRRSRVLWTPDLHLKFTAAISALGDKNARPKLILEMMNVPHLTQRQVASHLQKYRSQVKRICETGATNLPAVCESSNFFARSKALDSVDKNISAPTTTEGSQSSDSRIRDILLVSNAMTFSNPNAQEPTNLDKNLTGPSELNQEMNAVEASAIPGNESQAASGYVDLLKMLEKEEEEDFSDLAAEANPDDVDRYCQLLADVMLGNK